MLLKKGVFLCVNGIGVAFMGATAIYVLLSDAPAVVKGIMVLYSLGICAAVYLLNIRRISVDNMLYSIYLWICNCVSLCIAVFVVFLRTYKKNSPFEAIVRSIGLLIMGAVSFLIAMFNLVVRKYIVQGLVCPISLQRSKGIEYTVLLLRREYTEIFSVQ
ncbi:hypothetical protein NEOKW01_1623 [Nematocida sp. AWRm80]|nr:hypothetical protein NEOKW01_1623 [Nematocida sp. AWRm80]